MMPGRLKRWVFTACVALCWSTVAIAADAVWTPDPTVLDKLADPQQFGNYSLRPPKHYVLQAAPLRDGTYQFAWVTDPRDDGSRHYILALVIPPNTHPELHMLSEIVRGFVEAIRPHETNFKDTAPELGTVNGLVFARAYWSGTDPISGDKMHGFVYATRDIATVVEISSQDLEPFSTTSMGLTEASALTFQVHKPK